MAEGATVEDESMKAWLNLRFGEGKKMQGLRCHGHVPTPVFGSPASQLAVVATDDFYLKIC